MTIKEFLDGLDEMGNATREVTLRELTRVLSPPSIATLQNFQEKFMAENPEKPPFEVFVKAQNKEVVKCLEMEMSDIGGMVRGLTGFAPISLDTVIATEEADDND